MTFASADAAFAGGRRRARLWTAVCFLVVVAVGIEFGRPAFGAVAHFLVEHVKAALVAPTLGNLLIGGLAFGGWLVHLLITPLIIYGAFLLVEIALAGRPVRWAPTVYALTVQLALTLALVVISPVLGEVLPDGWGLRPLLQLEARHAPAWLAPFAPAGLAIASLLVLNFGQYWTHRLQHRLPLLWRFHAVHHSVENLDSLNSFTHPADGVGLRLVTVSIAVLIGFEFEAAVWLLALQSTHDRILHTRAPLNFGWAGGLLVDNRHHFLHHSIRPEDYDRNFSSWFTVWDHLFGTYKRPDGDTLPPTGLLEAGPPTTLSAFFLARLPARETSASQPPTAASRATSIRRPIPS